MKNLLLIINSLYCLPHSFVSFMIGKEGAQRNATLYPKTSQAPTLLALSLSAEGWGQNDK